MRITDKIMQAKQAAIYNYNEAKFTYEAILAKIQQTNSKSEYELLMQSNLLIKAKNNMDFWYTKAIQTGGMN